MIYFLRIFGLSIILLYIYIRFIVKRMPRDLIFFTVENGIVSFNYAPICITIIAMLTSCIIIYLSIKKINKKPVIVSSNVILKFAVNVLSYFKYVLDVLKEWSAQQIPNSYYKLYKICSIFYKQFGYYEKELCINLIVIPYLIVVSCFLVDIFLFFQLNYFYKGIVVLIIPLIYNGFLYLMQDIVSNLNLVEKELLVEHSYLPDGRDSFTFSRKSEYPLSNATFEFYANEYLKLIPFKGFLASYFDIESYYKPRLFFFIHTIYFIGWTFVLISNLFF